MALSADAFEDHSACNRITVARSQFVPHAADEFHASRVAFGTDDAPVLCDKFRQRLAFQAEHLGSLIRIDQVHRQFAVPNEVQQFDGRVFTIGESFDRRGLHIGGEHREIPK